MTGLVGEGGVVGPSGLAPNALGRVEPWPSAADVWGAAAQRRRPRCQRAVELALAVLALILFTPLLVTLALLVGLTSRGPVLFRQTRVGVGGRTFTMLKFRTMRVGAERERDRLRHLNEATGPLFKIRRDPRLTSVGRWMRRYSLDELPQLLNVIVGSMALVGPRPVLPDEEVLLTDLERRRHLVKPGVTGLAQVSGRSHLRWGEVVALDLQYVEQCSLRLDLWILRRTVAAVVLGRGAY